MTTTRKQTGTRKPANSKTTPGTRRTASTSKANTESTENVVAARGNAGSSNVEVNRKQFEKVADYVQEKEAKKGKEKTLVVNLSGTIAVAGLLILAVVIISKCIC